MKYKIVIDEKSNLIKSEQVIIGIKQLALQNEENESLLAELIIAKRELAFQNPEKGKWAAELIIANKKLAFKNREREIRTAELNIANRELVFQNEEKEKRAAELVIANKELLFQNEEKGKRASELVITNKEFQKITADLLQRNKDLEQFSYIVSHNLRAPVANIIGFSAIVQEENLEPEIRKELMEGLSHSVNQLDDVIRDLNNILNVRKGINEKKEMVYFSQLANNIHSSIENLIEKENAILFWDFSEVDEMLTLKSYLYSIFYNLISNSIKYHQPKIPPEIEIKSYKFNNKIELIFKDNGMGIDMDKKGDQVFGLYKRFHTSNAEGKGMGLYMIKTQVEAIGGKISIESEVNKGTNFKIEFENK